jgi:hypothetical protein
MQYVDFGDYYELRAYAGDLEFCASLSKTPLDTTDLLDFENNYKSDCNQAIAPMDYDGSVLTRVKVAPLGWQYHEKGIMITTSVVGSLYVDTPMGMSCPHVSAKFYDVDDALITDQEVADVSCVKTVVEFMPTHSYEIVGGSFSQGERPSENVFIHIIGAPDIPINSGGFKVFSHGRNLRLMSCSAPIKVDGRVSKHVEYVPEVPYANKIQLLMRHPAGFKHELLICLEIFKP